MGVPQRVLPRTQRVFSHHRFIVPDLSDFGFVYSQIRLYVSVEFLSVCHTAFVISESFYGILVKILRFDDLYL